MGEDTGPWRLDTMREEDLPSVGAIESASFRTPWPPAAFRGEFESPHARCIVARHRHAPASERLDGYICYWILGEELLINNLAVDSRSRRRGLGRLLLRYALGEGGRLGCRVAFLEVRATNAAARRLYESEGFSVVQRRRGYYADTREDALVMGTALKGSETG